LAQAISAQDGQAGSCRDVFVVRAGWGPTPSACQSLEARSPMEGRRAVLPRTTRPRCPHDDFREHVGFIGLMLVCCACVVYLMGVMGTLLRPFLWALFLVMGLTPAVASVERSLLCLAAMLYQCSAATMRRCCRLCHWVSCFFRRYFILKAGVLASAAKAPEKRRRLGAGSARETALPAVIGTPSMLADGASAASSAAGEALRDGGGVCLQIPTLAASSSAGVTEIDRELSETDGTDGAAIASVSRELGRGEPWGRCAQVIAHVSAIAVVVIAVLCVIGGFGIMVIQSVVSLQDHWSVYRRGALNMVESGERVARVIAGGLPQEVTDHIASNMLTRAEAVLSAIIRDLLGNLWHFIVEFLMMILYVTFWLVDPMPVGSAMEELFKRYIILKGLACLGYGVCVGLLFWSLSIDLAAPFGLCAFFLGFVPEVGPFVAVILPAPVIILDSRLKSPTLTLAIATSAQLLLKFLFANIVEVKLVEADQLMKMHPVIILMAVAFFGYIWGPTGMLLSVPLVAYFKVTLLSDRVPARYRDPLLVLLEGDRHAPEHYGAKKRDNVLRGSGGGAGRRGVGQSWRGPDRGKDDILTGSVAVVDPATPSVSAGLLARRTGVSSDEESSASAPHIRF